MLCYDLLCFGLRHYSHLLTLPPQSSRYQPLKDLTTFPLAKLRLFSYIDKIDESSIFLDE